MKFIVDSLGLGALIFFLVQIMGGRAWASQSDLLFVIERSTNANVVRYVANLTDKGTFDANEPVSAYWIMAAEDGHREDLTWFEREHVYGFSFRRDATGKILIVTTKAMEKLPIHVSISGGVAQAEAEIGGHAAFLKKVFVRASGGLFPGVDYIKLTGVDTTTGKEIEAVIHP